MASRSSSSARDPWEGYSAELETQRARSRLGLALILMLLLGFLVALYLFVNEYYGEEGVRLVGVVLGIGVLVLLIIGVGALVQFIAYRMSIEHHDNVVRGLVHAQQADDRGGNQVDGQMLRMADRLSRERMSLAQQQYEAQRALEDRRWQEEQQARTVDGKANFEW